MDILPTWVLIQFAECIHEDDVWFTSHRGPIDTLLTAVTVPHTCLGWVQRVYLLGKLMTDLGQPDRDLCSGVGGFSGVVFAVFGVELGLTFAGLHQVPCHFMIITFLAKISFVMTS